MDIYKCKEDVLKSKLVIDNDTEAISIVLKELDCFFRHIDNNIENQ